MTVFHVNRMVVKIEDEGAKPCDELDVYVMFSNEPKYMWLYKIVWRPGWTMADVAHCAFTHYAMGVTPTKIVERGIVDESGARRYTMTREQLQKVYKQFEQFVADCTESEYRENKQAIGAIYDLIKKHIHAEASK